MKSEDIQEKDIIKIFELYKKYCGGTETDKFTNPERMESKRVLKNVRERSIQSKDGWRIGSNWGNNAKLRFQYQNGEIVPKINYNYDSENEDSIKAKERFEEESIKYLTKTK